jgi:MFS family permease
MGTAPADVAIPSLWRNPAFVRLWIAKTVSGIGTSVTATAIPLTAALVLDATPAQMAALVFAGQLPDLLFGLVAGVWVDRVRRRPILIGTDLGRAILLAVIPVAVFLGLLSMPLLWIVAFGSAALTLFFTLASVAVLPTIVREEQLVDANAKLHMSEAVLTLAGPSAAGFLVQLVTAPKAIIADVVSYLASAFALGSIAATEVKPERRARGLGPVWREIREGLHELIRTPLLRALAISMGIIVVGGAMVATVNILFLTRTLELSPVTIGFVAAGTGVGSLLGAVVAGRVATRLTLGGAIVLSGMLEAGALFLTPLAAHVTFPVPWLMGLGVISGLAYSVLSINQISLRQRITPSHLLGRVTAARRFLIFCMAPVGAVAGGWLGTNAGLEATILAGAAVTLVGAIYMWWSPIRTAS